MVSERGFMTTPLAGYPGLTKVVADFSLQYFLAQEPDAQHCILPDL